MLDSWMVVGRVTSVLLWHTEQVGRESMSRNGYQNRDSTCDLLKYQTAVSESGEHAAIFGIPIFGKSIRLPYMVRL
jgi:hypothetical protein